MATAPSVERTSPVKEFARLVVEHEQREQLTQAHYHARLEASAVRSDIAAIETAADRATVAHVAFRRALEDVYRDPDRARQVFFEAVKSHGISNATYTLREQPETFGKLIAVDRPSIFGLLRQGDEQLARTAAVLASELGRSAVLAENRLGEVTTEVRARRLTTDRVQELRTVRRFEEALASIYQDPNAARRAFDIAVRQYGPDRAAAHFVDQPWRYGPIREAAPGARPYPEARARAATLGADAVRATRELPAADVKILREVHARTAVTTERTASTALAERAVERERNLADQLARLPTAEALGQRVKSLLQRLTPGEFQQAYQLLTAPQRALVASFKETIKEVLLGREGLQR